MFALNLAEDGRILSATYPEYAPGDAVLVEELPEGNIIDYCYADGAYVHDPLPEEGTAEPERSTEERIAELEEALALLLSGVTE